ncbi:ATP synthase gamma chain [Bacteroidia bacterium]|nr:ATP synthase gamma chain [Bacteroidia bacterium]
MSNLKEIRTRIDSVGSMEKITSAMKLVSASKLRKTQRLIIGLRPFGNNLSELTDRMLSTTVSDSPFMRPVSGKGKVLLVVIGSNSGLCGAFNSVIIKKTIDRIENFYKKKTENDVQLFCIGRKTAEFFQKHSNYEIFASNIDIFENISYEKAETVARDLLSRFENLEFDKIEIISNSFQNAAVYHIKVAQYLPFEIESMPENAKSDKDKYLYIPDKELIVNYLIDLCLKEKFYRSIIDSFTAEHGARMTAMHKATDNANEMLKQLRLSFNKARQASITNEIIEITNGANALNG